MFGQYLAYGAGDGIELLGADFELMLFVVSFPTEDLDVAGVIIKRDSQTIGFIRKNNNDLIVRDLEWIIFGDSAVFAGILDEAKQGMDFLVGGVYGFSVDAELRKLIVTIRGRWGQLTEAVGRGCQRL